MAAALPGASRCFVEPVSALLAHHTLRGPPELPSGQIHINTVSKTEYKVSLTSLWYYLGRV